MVTAQVKPGKLNDVIRYYDEVVLPAVEVQAGFGGLLLLTDRDCNKSVSIAFWETEEDMVAFATRQAPDLASQFSTLLAMVPAVDIYEVSLQSEAHPAYQRKVALSETSLGIRIAPAFQELDRLPAV
jgi:heme-degrading monooxygenase HmoA